MKQQRHNDGRPTRADLVAYLAERDRERSGRASGSHSSQFRLRKEMVAAEMPICMNAS